jgi:hypothetical protein
LVKRKIIINGGLNYMVFAYYLSGIIMLNLFFAHPAYAYIDPNTGGFFFQTVAPFVYGILGVIVVFWKRISGFVKGLINRKKDLPNSSENE